MKYLLSPFIYIAVVLFFSSCSSSRPKGKTEAEVLFKEAKLMIQKGRYLNATERLNQLRKKFPFSYYATPAELLLADILYKQENYVEAAAAYILFKDFHPKYPKMEYVLWQIGESFYKQLPSTYDRDISVGYEAIKYYNELLQRFPNTQHRKAAGERVKEVGNLFKKKEQYIADFYYKTEVFDAAVYRYKLILNTFSDPKLRSHAIERVILSYAHLKKKTECSQFYNEYFPLLKQEEKQRVQSLYEQCKTL